MALLEKNTSPNLSPRDIANLSGLKTHGLNLVEVRLSRFSQKLGKQVDGLILPEGSRIACVVHRNEPLMNLFSHFLQEGDVVYIVTDDETAVRDYFISL